MRGICKLALIFLFVISPSAQAKYKDMIMLKEKKNLVRVGEKLPKFTSYVSKRNLLGLRRRGVGALPMYKMTQAQAETIRVLALKVEFQREDPDDPRTTGHGQFDLRTKEEFRQQEHHLTDPAPHDSFYFNAHFRALNQYWEKVSKGRLVIVWDIYPKDETLSYTLPNSMSYYGCVGSSGDSLYKMLSRLFHDSFRSADSLSLNDLDISKYKFDDNYDAFMIFHAGADRQNDYGDSPCDLMTGFISLTDTVWVHVQGGDSTPVTEGMIMPETDSQDEDKWGGPWDTYWASAMNAAFAHEFGHQLGLPDLYNTLTSMTQAGDFSLMDNNALDVVAGVNDESGDVWFVSGAMPIYPDAWCTAYLGFVQPKAMDMDSLRDLKVLASELVSDTIQTVKVPINSDEYFLLENRRTDLDGSDSFGLKLDGLTDVVLYPVDARVDTFNGEYDYFIPGSGMLIWHVDEGVAYLDYDGKGGNNFEDNQLQWDKNRRFVSIVEADGIIDFGGDYYTGFGLQEDMFYLGNNSSFTPYTFPNSFSNTKANSHIFITNISRPGIQMSCDAFYDWFQFGWKQKVFPEQNASALVYADVDRDDKPEIFLSTANRIYGWKNNGDKLVDNDSVFLQVNLNGTMDSLPLAIFSTTDSSVVGPPSLGDLNGDDTLEVVAGDLSGKVYAWSIKDMDKNGSADILGGFPVQLGSAISCAPVISDFDVSNAGLEIFAGTQSGKYYLLSFDGARVDSGDFGEKVVGLATTDLAGMNFVVTENQTSAHLWNTLGEDFKISISSTSNSIPTAGDLNRDGNWEVVVVGGDKELYAWDDSLRPLAGFPVNLRQNTQSPAVLGDIDGDGYLEIILVGENRILAYNYNGTLATEFPLTADRTKDLGLIKSSPVLADINGDGLTDMVFGTPDREIMAFDGRGKGIDGFPLSCGAEVKSSAIILDLDQDRSLELLSVAGDGFVYAWDLRAAYDSARMIWSMYGYDERHTNSFPLAKLPSLPIVGELMPDKSVYNYPNPAGNETFIRYFLSKDAQVEIKIYDLAGDLVFKTMQSGWGQTDNEYRWDCSKFASGVYVCRVEAKSENEKKIAFCKIALVK